MKGTPAATLSDTGDTLGGVSTPPGSLYDRAAVVDEEIEFAGHRDDPVGGYLARPIAPGPLPGVVVVHALPGLNEHTRDVVRRIAALGHVCCVPDLYSRDEPTDDFGELMGRMFAREDAFVLGDLAGAAAHLRGRGDATGRVGCIGFCMGGRYTLLLACTTDGVLDAAVDCWGGFITRADPDNVSTPQRPVPPLDLAERLSCPLLAAIGLDDHNPSPQDGRLLEERLARSPHETRVDFYENAGHAFFDDTRDGYRPQAASLLWERVVEFWARTLHD